MNGKLSGNLFFFFGIFAGKNIISLRSVQIRIFCLWLKYAFFVNSKHYSRSNGTKGNFKPRKYLLLDSVLQALVSVTCFSEGLAGLQHNREKCTSSSTGLENVFNVKKKSQQANNINLSVNCVIESSTFSNGPQNSS